jgi:hypothetical protein
MCDVNGQFKLCTCSKKVDKSKPYWVLKSNRQDSEEHFVVGMFSEPNPLFTPIFRRNILRRLNSVKSIFDFDYNPNERDLLKLCGTYDEYYCEFRGGKWRWLEDFQYIGKKSGNYRNKKKGYIKSSRSELIKVLDEYESITKTSLYRNDDYWVFVPKNDFEKELYYSKKMNQKEIIEMIQEEIQRIKLS